MKPKVSICIPTYNQVQYIREAVESALAQKFDSFEVVVSDNHCTDGTSEYLQSVRDERLRVVRPPEHVGVAHNLDFVFANSRGSYFTFLCSDDTLEPDYAAKMSARLDSNEGAAFAYCASWLVDGEGKRIGLERNIGGNRRRSGDEAIKRFMRGSRCVFDTLMIRREAYEACGKMALLRGGVYLREIPDWDLDIRLAMQGDVVYLDEVLVGFRYWSAENRDKNAVRLPRYIEEIGRIFDTTVAEVLEARPHLKRDALAARKELAVNCAVGVGELYGLESFESSCRDVLKIHDSPMVRFIMALHTVRLTPLFAGWRAAKGVLRRHVKQLLYQS